MKSPEEFIERIKRSFQTPSSKDERIKVVLICVVISTTFWFFSALNKEDYITQINYPIAIEFDEEAFVAVGDLPDRVPIEVTGGGWDLMTRSFGLNMEPIAISLNRPSEVSYVLTNSIRGSLAPNLDPVAINFILLDSITFDIQKRVTRTVGISVDLESIDLATDYIVDSDIVLTPSILTVTGPEQFVNSIPDTVIISLSENRIDENFDQNLDIPLMDDLVSYGIEKVNVSFEVANLITVTHDYPIQIINAPDSTWEILPNYLSVNAKMRTATFDATDTLMFQLQVDYNKRTSDSLVAIDVIQLEKNLLEYSIELDSVKLFKNE